LTGTDKLGELHGRDVIERVLELADRAPERPLYIELFDGSEESARLTARELRDRAANLAGVLAEGGVKPGDVVLMIATPPCEFLVALVGCMWAGVIAAPIAFPRRVEHLKTRLEPVRANAGAVAVVAAPASKEAEREVLDVLTEGTLPVFSTDAKASQPMAEPIAERDIAYLQYTSGSTSEPRGVIVDHSNLMANLETIRQLLSMEEDSINVSWCPLTHDMGLIMGALPSIYLGMLSVLMPPGAFIRRPLLWLKAFDRYRGTHGYSPNFGYDLLVDRSKPEQRAELDLSSVKVLVNGAEPVRRRTGDRLNEAYAVAKLSPNAHAPSYGLAEASVLVSATPATRQGRVFTVDAAALEQNELVFVDADANVQVRELCGDGVLGKEYDARIVDPETLEDLGEGRIGELWIKGPSVCRGYWKRDEMTKDAFGARTKDGDGPFLRTGDLAFIKDGELVICGRAKDLIVIHGRNLYPQDIELEVELSHDAVRSGGSAAFAVEEDDEEALVVVAEVDGEPDEDEVKAAINGAVLREFELRLKDVMLVPPLTVPKTSSGKKQRRATRKLWAEARQREVAGAGSS